MMQPVIVISGVSMTDSGILSILRACLNSLEQSALTSNYRIIALVPNKSLLPAYVNVELLEFQKAKKHYYYRLYAEFWKFYQLSKQLKPILWLSLHDISPRVKAAVQAVYMHNPTPFYEPGWLDWKFIPKNAIWAYLYQYLYRLNIHANRFLIVQQSWIRTDFSKRFRFLKERIIVARPVEKDGSKKTLSEERATPTFTFIYPSYPRVFKNFEIVCKAVALLEKEGFNNIKVLLTIDGTENKYSAYILKKFAHLQCVEFRGILPPEKMEAFYQEADCLLFPSKLETWGLPISEFMPFEKPMIISDLPYAYETASGARQVAFFKPDDARSLADRMKEIALGDSSHFNPVKPVKISEPVVEKWEALFNILLESADIN